MELSHDEILGLFNNSLALVQLCNRKRLELPTSPTQSNFRVYAFLIIERNGTLSIIEGTNGEQGYIGGAICAERSALLKLRFITDYSIKKVVVVTDSVHTVSPGLLCREYLMSSCDPSTPVVMGNHSSEVITECSIGMLLPLPYVYRWQVRQNVLEYAKEFSSRLEAFTDDQAEIKGLHEIALSCIPNDRATGIHPIQFAAAVSFDDGSVEVAWILKGLEYGCTVDPVCQLVREMEIRRNGSNVNRGKERGTGKPKLLIMVDQFGVAHAPFAPARALITEHGYGDVKIVVHDDNGKVVVVEANSLAPTPNGIPLLSHDDFDR